MKLLLKILLVLIALIIAHGYLHKKEARYACLGTIDKVQMEKDAPLYVRLTQFRWWVGLWAESQGSLLVEFPRGNILTYTHILGNGDHLNIFDGVTGEHKFKGRLSTLSGKLKLNTYLGIIETKCITQ